MKSDKLLPALSVAAAVTGELMVAGKIQVGSAWAPLNAIAPLLLDPEAADEQSWHPVITPVGLGITVSGITAWAVLHNLLLDRLPGTASEERTTAIAAGLVSGVLLALFDYRVLPPHRRPRLARWLSPAAIACKYVVMAGGLAVSRGAFHTGEARPARDDLGADF